MSVYVGVQHSDGIGHQLVTKDDDVLIAAPSQRIINHSPTGFNWGYGGSGPAQLALAILYDVTGDEEVTMRFHHQFKRDFVARWGEKWMITTSEILVWLEKKMRWIPSNPQRLPGDDD